MDQQRPLPGFEDISIADGQTLWIPGYTERNSSWPDSKLRNEPTGACTVHGRHSKAKKKRQPFGISCVACYQRKKKCLGGKPCNDCRARGKKCERRQRESSLNRVGITRQNDRANKGINNLLSVESDAPHDQSPTMGIQDQESAECCPDMATHNMEGKFKGSSRGNQGIDQSLPNILSIRAWQTPEIQSNGPPRQAVTENGPSNLGGQGSEGPPHPGEYVAPSGVSQLTPTPCANEGQPAVYSPIGVPRENFVETESSANSFMPVHEWPFKDAPDSSNHRGFDEDPFFMPREPWTLPGFLELDRDPIYGQQNVDWMVCPSTALRQPASTWERWSLGWPIEPTEIYPHYEGYSDEKRHDIETWLSGTEQEGSQS